MYCYNCGENILDTESQCKSCGTYKQGYKNFSWLGFFFSTFYYAGKNIKKAIIITIIYTFISCILDYLFITNTIYQMLSGTFYFVILGTYIGFSVTKEPNYIQKKFNWTHANTFALVLFLVTFTYQIYTFKYTNPELYNMFMQTLGTLNK